MMQLRFYPAVCVKGRRKIVNIFKTAGLRAETDLLNNHSKAGGLTAMTIMLLISQNIVQ
jgi:hypothetical protein